MANWKDYNLDEVIDLYNAGVTQAEIGRRVGLTQTSVGYALRKAGVATRRTGPSRRYRLAEGYFADIATPEQAYWLGFLAADGFSIRRGGRPHGIGVRLGAEDVGHLYKLAEALESDTPVRKRPDGCVEVRFHSARLASDAGQHGIIANKTFDCVAWEAPDHLARHYWRGVIDGDGCIATAEYNSLIFTGTRAMCNSYLDFAKRTCGTRSVPFKSRSGEVWVASLSGRRQVRTMLGELYGDCSVSLDRKQARADAILALPYTARAREQCCVADCFGVALARAMCSKHYQRWAKHGDPHANFDKKPGHCSLPECDRPHLAKGYCGPHYRKWKAHGDPHAGRPLKSPAGTGSADP